MPLLILVFLILGGLVLFDVLALHFGVDSRETGLEPGKRDVRPSI